MLIMIRVKKIINAVFVATTFLCWACPPLSAQTQSEAIRSRYNESIEAIAKDIIQTKKGYPELEGFSRSAISQDSNGFESIYYVHDSSGYAHDPYSYSLTINIKTLSGNEPQNGGSPLEIKFPLLGIKVVVDSQNKGESVSFDLRRIVESDLEGLRILEQNYLPFRLELKSQKDVYSVQEDITITALLRNTGIKAFKVADLDEDSLYCKIGNKDWGNPEPAVEFNKVLSAHGTIQKVLTISGVDDPQDLWIACTYAIGFQGVQPYQRIKISIKPKG
jgi:hypothetical protein